LNTTHFKVWPARLPFELVYPQVPLYEFLETSARRYPDKDAVIYYGQRLSYRTIWEQSLALAGALHRAGIQPGDRVALYLQNTPHYLVGFYGILRANAVVVPLNPMLIEEELAFLLNDCGARVVITTADLYQKVRAIAGRTAVETVIAGQYGDYLPAEPELPVPASMLTGFPLDDVAVLWQDLLRERCAPPGVQWQNEDLALLPYTAGSTGRSKGCMHTHATVISNVVSSALWNGVTSGSVCLATLPFFHVTGMVHSLHGPILAGASIVLLTRWDREAALQAIEKYRCTHWTNITTMLIDLLAHPEIGGRDVSSLLSVGGGGAPMPAAVAEKFHGLTGLQFVEGYGLTETISQTHMNPPDRPKLQCLGIPDFGVDARIIDTGSLREVPGGEEGELIVAGPEVMKGYWQRPEEDAEAFLELDGKRFLRTGDICRVDEEGYFFIVDRKKRMINAAGFKVWPTEVEGVLYRHPAVAEVCVIGVPDPHRGENTKAYIILRPEFVGRVSEADIVNWARENMASYKYPRIVQFTDSLPKSGAGKVLWRQLQDKEKEMAATRR